MAEKNDPQPILRCRRCGHTIQLPAASSVTGEEEALGRCPNCGRRSLVLTVKGPVKTIKIN
jgi:DNA-directed RNA polymerase subunit RPC12/RpoP